MPFGFHTQCAQLGLEGFVGRCAGMRQAQFAIVFQKKCHLDGEIKPRIKARPQDQADGHFICQSWCAPAHMAVAQLKGAHGVLHGLPKGGQGEQRQKNSDIEVEINPPDERKQDRIDARQRDQRSAGAAIALMQKSQAPNLPKCE